MVVVDAHDRDAGRRSCRSHAVGIIAFDAGEPAARWSTPTAAGSGRLHHRAFDKTQRVGGLSSV
jgi:hypothetical protein